jgi:hypothetical protein
MKVDTAFIYLAVLVMAVLIAYVAVRALFT